MLLDIIPSLSWNKEANPIFRRPILCSEQYKYNTTARGSSYNEENITKELPLPLSSWPDKHFQRTLKCFILNWEHPENRTGWFLDKIDVDSLLFCSCPIWSIFLVLKILLFFGECKGDFSNFFCIDIHTETEKKFWNFNLSASTPVKLTNIAGSRKTRAARWHCYKFNE